MSVLRRLQNHPKVLERAFYVTVNTMQRAEPLLRKIGLSRLTGVFVVGEKVTKGAIFNCQMCGSCMLHKTGMTCPMTCPKNLRNGPCGGVRMDGKCEIKPEMDCVWVKAWQRSETMPLYGDGIQSVHPPLDRRLQGTSAWLNMLDQTDTKQPENWIGVHDIPIRH